MKREFPAITHLLKRLSVVPIHKDRGPNCGDLGRIPNETEGMVNQMVVRSFRPPPYPQNYP